jgi:hypothetical protein
LLATTDAGGEAATVAEWCDYRNLRESRGG